MTNVIIINNNEKEIFTHFDVTSASPWRCRFKIVAKITFPIEFFIAGRFYVASNLDRGMFRNVALNLFFLLTQRSSIV